MSGSRWCLLALMTLGLACGKRGVPSQTPEPRAEVSAANHNASGSPFFFREQTLPFVYERGETGLCWPVEPVGGGVALLDVDLDGDLDVFLPQGKPLLEQETHHHDVLLRNDDGRFVDVSAEVGLEPRGYGMGVTVADYDADGDPDLYVTRYKSNTLWRNEGGTFLDVTDELGLQCPLWSLGAAFADMDNDGDLDLLVANYLKFSPEDAPFARNPETGEPEYAVPQAFGGLPNRLFRNDGRRFVEVAQQAGLDKKLPSMAVLAADFDQDGWIDWLVANDGYQNTLWRNLGDGRYEEIGALAGVAFNGQGKEEADMGIAFGDTDGDGLADILITHFRGEHDTLWRARHGAGTITFLDETFKARLVQESMPLTGWGTAFADFDQDGDLDLVVATGHIRRWERESLPYENPPLLWENPSNGLFHNVAAHSGAYFTQLHQARGLAVGDLDGDGDLDLVVVHHHASSVVLWNESPKQGNFLRVRLVGAGKNRDAIGARVTVRTGDHSWVRWVTGGGGYLSAHDPTLHFGIGPHQTIDRLEIRWPSGTEELRTAIPANTTIECTEGAPPPRPRGPSTK